MISYRHDKYQSEGDNFSADSGLVDVSLEFISAVEDMLSSKDDHLKMAANFWFMARTLDDFVNSYRVQDSVAVEHGYHLMAPYWKCLGQNKYVDCWANQVEQQSSVTYARVQEYRTNRMVRTYPANTGKYALAIDEWIEICNRDFSLLPSVRSLVGMCRQGYFIGMRKRCKRAHEMFYGHGDLADRKVYSKGTGSKGNQTPEKQLMYKFWDLFLGGVFSKIDPDVHYAGQKFEKSFIHGQEGSLKPD